MYSIILAQVPGLGLKIRYTFLHRNEVFGLIFLRKTFDDFVEVVIGESIEGLAKSLSSLH